MIFTSFDYVAFFAAVFFAYWAIRCRKMQNVLMLVASYVFYGWATPWFCLLLAASTLSAYFCGRGMTAFPQHKKKFLATGLLFHLGMLGTFKYFNFFCDNVAAALALLGIARPPVALLQLVLPAGISFYTFQAVGYLIDICRGHAEPRKNFIDLALFVSFFPQLLSGPIERANALLPQIEQDRNWSWKQFDGAWPLILEGFFKKLVIADNLAFYADKVFMLQAPGPVLLAAGVFAYSLQIYADFSGYTDMARGSARMLGFELSHNFDFPYFAVSPSDFWRRWHISLSAWIRDYIYIPLGGSRQKNRCRYGAAVLTTMALCGLWHGASWNFVLWGAYHGLAILVYSLLGLGGRWRPKGKAEGFLAWIAMLAVIQFGWLIFRAPTVSWVAKALAAPAASGDLVVAAVIAAYCLFYLLPLGALVLAKKYFSSPLMHAPVHAAFLVMIAIFQSDAGQDFIYFQF